MSKQPCTITPRPCTFKTDEAEKAFLINVLIPFYLPIFNIQCFIQLQVFQEITWGLIKEIL